MSKEAEEHWTTRYSGIDKDADGNKSKRNKWGMTKGEVFWEMVGILAGLVAIVLFPVCLFLAFTGLGRK